MSTRHLLKVLGISMLAAIGVMAISASAAQAKWLILEGTNSVLETKLAGSGTLGAMLVPGLFQIECHKSKAEAILKLSADHKTLTGSGIASSAECLVKDSKGNVNANCTVDSPGGAAETITTKGEGKGAMEGSKVFATLISANFSEIEIIGAKCSLDEFDDTVNGTLTLTLDNAESKTTAKTALLDDTGFFYGENSAQLHDGVNTANPISATVVNIRAGEWLVGLVGL